MSDDQDLLFLSCFNLKRAHLMWTIFSVVVFIVITIGVTIPIIIVIKNKRSTTTGTVFVDNMPLFELTRVYHK